MVEQLADRSAPAQLRSDRFTIPDRVAVLGCGIDRADMAQTVETVDSVIADRGFARHVSINAAKLVAMHDDEELRELLSGCELVSADGQPVVWAARLLGDPLPERVAGIDLMQELLALAERRGYRVFFFGATSEVLARALVRIRERHPRLVVAGARDGYFPTTIQTRSPRASQRADRTWSSWPCRRRARSTG